MDYSESIDVFDIKVGIFGKLNEYMDIYKYQSSRSFFYRCLRSLRYSFYPVATGQTEVKLHIEPS